MAVPAFFEIPLVQRLTVNFPIKFFKKYMRVLYKCMVDWERSAAFKKEAHVAGANGGVAIPIMLTPCRTGDDVPLIQIDAKA
jgi:hypothetical protein